MIICRRFLVLESFLFLLFPFVIEGCNIQSLFNSLPPLYYPLLNDIQKSIFSSSPISPRKSNASKRTIVDRRDYMDSLIILIFRNGRVIDRSSVENELPPAPIRDGPLRERASSLPDWDESVTINSVVDSASSSHIDTPINGIIPSLSPNQAYRKYLFGSEKSREAPQISHQSPDELPLFIYSISDITISFPLFPRDIVIFSTFPSPKMLRAKETRIKNRAYNAARRKIEFETEKMYCNSEYTLEDLERETFEEDKLYILREIEEEMKILSREKEELFSTLRKVVLNLGKATSKRFLNEEFQDLEVALWEILPQSFPPVPILQIPKALTPLSASTTESLTSTVPSSSSSSAVTFPALLRDEEDDISALENIHYKIHQSYGSEECILSIDDSSRRFSINLKEFSAILFDSREESLSELSHIYPSTHDRFIIPSIEEGTTLRLIFSWKRKARMGLLEDEFRDLCRENVEFPHKELLPRDGSQIAIFEITK